MFGVAKWVIRQHFPSQTTSGTTGELLKYDSLSPQVVEVISNTASALTAAQGECDSKSTKDRVGLMGLIGMMRLLGQNEWLNFSFDQGANDLHTSLALS